MSEGSAFGAVTILNATANGHGSSLAVQAGVRADWMWTTEPGLSWKSPIDDALAQACFARMRERIDRAGAVATTESTWPASKGLKTSSGAAAALLRAAAEDADVELSNIELEVLAVQCSRDAGVTLTGAFDDQVATVRGGCHRTDNPAMLVLDTLPIEPWHVAVWVPEATIPKDDLRDLDASILRPKIEEAERLLIDGNIPGAMTLNGAAFTEFYAAHGLPVTAEPAKVALEAGALGAGLSGTGPAVAALFSSKSKLPEVVGGIWQWTRAQEAIT